MLYVAKGEDYSLWKTSAITEIAPLGSSWRQLVYIQSGLILSGHFPLCLGCFSSIFHCWESSLVWISGRNMGSTSSITRVWDIVMIHNTYRSLPDLLPMIPDQMCRPWKHPGRSKQKDWIRQPELGCKTQMLASVCHHI